MLKPLRDLLKFDGDRLDISEPIPAVCFRLPTDATVQFTAERDEQGRVPFRMLARSYEPVVWWGWSLYHDFEGMTHKQPSIPADFLHDDAESIGFIDTFEVTDAGLEVGGFFTPVDDNPNDVCQVMLARGCKGVPYEASIDFRGPTVIEEVDVGMTSTVNGQEVEGPALIFRQWTLKAVAVCPHGRDPHTSTSFSSDADELLSLTFSETPVPKPKMSGAVKKPGSQQQSDKPADTPPAPASQQSETSTESGDGDTDDESEPESQQSEPAPAEPSSTDRELAVYCETFGHELGSRYFLAGHSFAEAQAKFAAHRGEQWAAEKADLTQQLAAANERADKAEAQLKAASSQLGDTPLGDSDTDPGDSTDDGDDAAFATDGVNAFASSIKLPGQK